MSRISFVLIQFLYKYSSLCLTISTSGSMQSGIGSMLIGCMLQSPSLETRRLSDSCDNLSRIDNWTNTHEGQHSSCSCATLRESFVQIGNAQSIVLCQSSCRKYKTKISKNTNFKNCHYHSVVFKFIDLLLNITKSPLNRKILQLIFNFNFGYTAAAIKTTDYYWRK